MDTKNNWAWNDCERCKKYDKCYYSAGQILKLDAKLLIVDSFFMLSSRDLCINNGKRLFKDKEGAENG